MAVENIADLTKLNYTKQLVFSYLTCERLYPNYVYFSNNFHFGNKQILRSARCVATGATPNEVNQRIKQAIELHVKSSLEDGDDIPAIFQGPYELVLFYNPQVAN